MTRMVKITNEMLVPGTILRVRYKTFVSGENYFFHLFPSDIVMFVGVVDHQIAQNSHLATVFVPVVGGRRPSADQALVKLNKFVTVETGETFFFASEGYFPNFEKVL